MSGATKILAAAGGKEDAVYVEDCFQTFLYTGDVSAASRKLTTGMDFDDKGGLAWFKRRESEGNPALFDTERSGLKYLMTNNTNAETAQGSPADFISFNDDGVNIGQNNPTNTDGEKMVMWQFLKQPGFFDIQTWTGNGVAGRQISHDLESVPGFIITKRLDDADNWKCYHVGNHASAPEDYVIELDSTNNAGDEAIFHDTAPTSTYFTVSAGGAINASSNTYVAYLFANDAEVFGAGSDESIIKCGAFEAGSGEVAIDLGWEPQYLLTKPAETSSTNYWGIYDMMRGLTESVSNYLKTNDNPAESDNGIYKLKANGFISKGGHTNGARIIYMAIRRPMKTPDAGTKVFIPNAYTGNGSSGRVLTSSNSPVDSALWVKRNSGYWYLSDRLRGATESSITSLTAADYTQSDYILGFDQQSGYEVGDNNSVNGDGDTYVSYMLSRAPEFMDIVVSEAPSYAITNHAHNLTVVPELIISKAVDGAVAWYTMGSVFENVKKYILLNDDAGTVTSGADQWTATTSVVSVLSTARTDTHLIYLFATLAGISKVGSYTADASLTTIDCGFSAAARFILIKRTDATGNWYIYDSARGIIAGNDPYSILNDAAADVTDTDHIDPIAAGFQITAAGSATVNVDGGEYIFLAIA